MPDPTPSLGCLCYQEYVQLGQGVHAKRIRATMTSATSAIAVDIASDKDLTTRLLGAAGLPGRLLIDASHDNSGKNHSRQPGVVSDLARRLIAGEGSIVGVMLESFIAGGRQQLRAGGGLTYGQSITDACIAWDDTVGVLERLAAAVRARRP